jgi:hypothetical protein
MKIEIMNIEKMKRSQDEDTHKRANGKLIKTFQQSQRSLSIRRA